MFSVTIPVKLKPFKVPNFVLPEDVNPGDGGRSFPLRDIEPKVLSAMCDKFREDVFLKAERQDPRLK